jgi:predicted RNase H-like HicB family nuclease
MPLEKTYTAIIRKSRLEYVAICLEINVSARGADIPEVEQNLKNAINEYLEYIIEAPETEVAPL